MNPVKNQSLGANFEAVVARSFLARPGVFTVDKVTPPARIVGKRVIFTRNPFLDFVGVITLHGIEKGVPLFVECKATSGDVLRFGKGGLSDEQFAALRRWHAARACAFLLWCSVGNGVRVLGVNELERAVQKARSMRFNQVGTQVPLWSDQRMILDMVSAVSIVEQQNQTKG